MSEPNQIHVSANRMDFTALEWGDPGAPLALLIHGYPDTAWTWRHLGPYLAERGWHAVAPFTRGYAPSDLAPDDRYFVADLADDVLELHAALGGDGRAALIGHDWGAITTWAVTEKAPERFAKYCALAVPPSRAILAPFTARSTVRMGMRQARMSWYMLYNQLPRLSDSSLDRLIPRLWRDWSPGFDGAKDAARVLEALNTPARRRAALRYYRNNLQRGLVKTFTISAGAPALYLHGADDGCLQPGLVEAHPEVLAAGSRLQIVPGVGHFLQLEDPDRINALIGDWLAG